MTQLSLILFVKTGTFSYFFLGRILLQSVLNRIECYACEAMLLGQTSR